MSTKRKFYSYNKLYSYNAVYNFVVGGRGIGKTFGAKKKVIASALRNGDQFIYLRRYKSELTAARNTFFADIAPSFPKYDFRINGPIAQAAPISTREDKKRFWNDIGYFIALSTSQNQKSVAFPKVKTIIYDEFIIEKGALHYLPNEATIFNNFYSTVDRYTDKTKVLFLANSVSIMNPYFIEYEIRPDQEKEFIVKSDGFLVCHFPDSDDFKNDIYQTKFGKFIKDSEYAQYSVENTFDDNTEAMLELKDSKARYMFTLETKNGQFSVWFNMFSSQYYIQDKLPKVNEIFTLLPERMDNHKTLLIFSDRPLAMLRNSFRQGNVSFDKPSTRNTFAEIFKR